jgi:hypothetical protein
MRKITQPTWTSLATQALEGRDDFMTTAQLSAETGADRGQMNAALSHLRRHHAVDCVIERDGVAWWFATTACDTRLKCLDERALETCPRQRRTYRKKPKEKTS